jgi:hypothetical protein
MATICPANVPNSDDESELTSDILIDNFHWRPRYNIVFKSDNTRLEERAAVGRRFENLCSGNAKDTQVGFAILGSCGLSCVYDEALAVLARMKLIFLSLLTECFHFLQFILVRLKGGV